MTLHYSYWNEEHEMAHFTIGREATAKFLNTHKAERLRRTESLRRRLQAKVIEHGDQSIYAEMLAEMPEGAHDGT